MNLVFGIWAGGAVVVLIVLLLLGTAFSRSGEVDAGFVLYSLVAAVFWPVSLAWLFWHR